MERETEAERRARILAALERSLAEGLPAANDAGWQYPPAPLLDVSPPEPPLARGILALLGAVVVIVVVALVAAVVDGATIPACQIAPSYIFRHDDPRPAGESPRDGRWLMVLEQKSQHCQDGRS